MKKILFATVLGLLLATGSSHAAQKTITVGTIGSPASLDTNFGNVHDNFSEVYGRLDQDVKTTSNPSFLSVHASGGNLAAANAQVTKKWITGLPYTADVTSVIHGGRHFICSTTHTASAAGATGDEPGVGDTWATKWKYAGDAVHPYGDNTMYSQDGEPATCAVGDVWIDTNGTSGQRLYTCETANTWVAQAGSGSGISHATSDGGYYASKDGAWASLTGVYQASLTNPIVAAGAQSITGAKTFDASMLLMKGSSTGVTTFATANTSANNYTVTFPAKTGTAAMLDDFATLVHSTGLTVQEDTPSAGTDTVTVTYPVTAEAFSGSGWNGDTGGLTRNDAYDQLHIGDTDDDGAHDKLDTIVTPISGTTVRFDSGLQGRMVFNSYSSAQTLTVAAHNASVVQMTVADEVTLWDCETASVGDFVLLWAKEAEKIEVVPASGDHFVLFAGTALTADYELDMAATAGTKITLMCTADDTWSVYTETAACADGGAAD